MNEKICGLESNQKNPFNINCEFCNENANILKEKIKLPCNEVVHGYGDINSEIVFVGEGPGKNGAARTGIPFTRDESGKRLQLGLIKSRKYSEGDESEVINNKEYIPKLKNVYITNLYRFYGYKKLNKNEKREILEDARQHLIDEISNLKKFDSNVKIIPVGKNSSDEMKKLKLIDSTSQYLDHPSTKNPKKRKNREEWIKMFLDYLNQIT